MSTPDSATLLGLVPLRGGAIPGPPLALARAIAHHLSQINRWAGATETPLSVAQHSVLCYDVFRELFPKRRHQAIYALLHDGHEYLISDLLGPLESLIEAERPGFRSWLAGLKGEIDARIRAGLGVPEPYLDPSVGTGVPKAVGRAAGAPSRGTARTERGADIDLLAAIHDADLVTADLEWKLRIPADNGRSPFADHAARFPRIVKPRLALLTVPAAAELFERALVEELVKRRWEQ